MKKHDDMSGIDSELHDILKVYQKRCRNRVFYAITGLKHNAPEKIDAQYISEFLKLTDEAILKIKTHIRTAIMRAKPEKELCNRCRKDNGDWYPIESVKDKAIDEYTEALFRELGIE